MSTGKRTLRGALAAALALAIGGGVAARRLRPAPVAVASIERGTAVEAVYATGTVEAEDRVEVKARVAGVLASIEVKVGGRVVRGDLLARIDAPAAAFEVERARAELAAAEAHAAAGSPELARLAALRASLEADLGAARAEAGRAERLLAEGVTPAVELERARARAEALAAAVAANQAEARAARIDLDAALAQKRAAVRSASSRLADAEVRAPIDGVVLARRVEPGEVVAQNQPLFKVGDADRLVLEVSVDEADVARVHDGARGGDASPAAVTLYALPDRVLRGHVFEVLPDANRERKAFTIKVRLDRPEAALRSGMSAEVNVIAAERPGVLLAPSDAVDRGAVWVVREGRARRVEVVTGLRDLARVEVGGGVREGDQVVLGDTARLEEGARVAAPPAAPRAADARGAVETAAR